MGLDCRGRSERRREPRTFLLSLPHPSSLEEEARFTPLESDVAHRLQGYRFPDL